ncbi:MAG: O-antigen ligase family protein [Planctomycetia bacterium]
MATGPATLSPAYWPPARSPGGVASPQATPFPWATGIAVIPLLATFMRIASPPTATLSYLLIAAYAFMGRRQAVLALYLCCLFNLMNHGFPGRVPSGAALLRYIVFFSAALSVLFHGRSRQAPRQGFLLLAFTFLLCMLITVHCLAVSPIMDVSLLKSLSFTIVAMTLFAGWSWMDPTERRLTEQMIVGGLMIAAVASIPLIRMSIGYMKNPGLFQGVTVHPNNFGPIMAILAIVMATQCLTLRPLRPWRVGMLGVALLMVILSKSRMSLVAFVGGIAIGFLAEMFRGVLAHYKKSPRMVAGRLAAGCLLLLVLVVLRSNSLAAFYDDVIRTGQKDVENIGEAFQKSRGFLIEKLQRNIAENPLTGIGFGIASDSSMWVGIDRDPIFGLPLMYTIEKGVMPLAVLEELGIPLGMLVFLWIAMISIRATRGGIVPLTAYSVAILTNLSESTLFSPGGMGMMILLMAGWAATAPPGGAWVRPLPKPRPVPVT